MSNIEIESRCTAPVNHAQIRKGIEMLTQTIKFDIFDFNSQRFEEDFAIPYTDENFEMICRHKFTRNIRFEKEIAELSQNWMSFPLEFIQMRVWAMLAKENPEFLEYELV